LINQPSSKRLNQFEPGSWPLDAFDFSLQNLIPLIGALMVNFGVYWFVNGVWGMKKVAAPTPAAIEQGIYFVIQNICGQGSEMVPFAIISASS
jgi:hypothetical protein